MENKRIKPLISELVYLDKDYTQAYIYIGGEKFESLPKPVEIIEETDEYTIVKKFKPIVHDYSMAERYPEVTILAAAMPREDY